MANEKKILIVEDEKPMAHALEMKFNNSGFKAKAVFNGKEALEELEKEKYDIALLDLVMPVMDGFTVLEGLKKNKLVVPVIVTTNLSQEEDEDRAKALGAVGFLVKSDTPISGIVEYVKKTLKI